MAAEPAESKLPAPLELASWGLAGALLLAIYVPICIYMAQNWWYDDNYSHGFFIPLISGWLIWRQRHALARLDAGPNPWGLAVVAAGLLILTAGRWGHEFFLQRLSLIPVLWGLVLAGWGWPVARRVLFAFAYLLLMIPLPYMIYDAAAFPLRLIAASLAGSLLRLWGLPVLVEGVIIHLPANILNVVDACSGVRSLVSLIAAVSIMAYVWLPNRWSKALVVLLAPPAAVLSNALRVTAAGILAEHYGRGMLEGAAHDLVGWVVFMIAFLLLMGVTRLLAAWGRSKGGDRET